MNQNDKEGEEGIENYYLTVTGSSAEHDDPGQVGRGNRVNGFIAPLRFQNVEAIAGKNLTRHVGGFFNFWANEIAKAIWNEFSIASQVILLCEIGQPIRSPYVFITLEEAVSDSPLQRIVEEVIDNHGTIIKDILKGEKRDIYPFNYL